MSFQDFAPAYDNIITRKYSAKTIEHKKENRKELLMEYGWESDQKRMILALPEGMMNADAGALFEELLPGILSLSVGILIRGKGPKKYGDALIKLTKDHPSIIGIVNDDEPSLRRLFAGSDASLFLGTEMSDELLCSLKYGSVPIAFSQSILSDYSPVQESGNAFVFNERTAWHAFAALVRALETFKLPYDFRTIQKNAMEGKEIEDRR